MARITPSPNFRAISPGGRLAPYVRFSLANIHGGSSTDPEAKPLTLGHFSLRGFSPRFRPPLSGRNPLWGIMSVYENDYTKMQQFSLVILTSRFEATRGLFRDGPRHFEPRSDDEDDAWAGTPSPNFLGFPAPKPRSYHRGLQKCNKLDG
ncbi:hypothetical protein AVEN_252406-1 [Araneus ventricosus]|uniref:Uncharacterized protein n=1 Tax=Araneus ventricosus TaxID=182803 RepID=A0A4Y2ASH9_ARAVE|nr:hypothetical protein AVEN_252406-1 [Araneus ventricosus]